MNFIKRTYREWYDKYKGSLRAILKVKPGKEDLLKQELRDICRRVNAVDTSLAKFYIPAVTSHTEQILSNPHIDIEHGFRPAKSDVSTPSMPSAMNNA